VNQSGRQRCCWHSKLGSGPFLGVGRVVTIKVIIAVIDPVDLPRQAGGVLGVGGIVWGIS
jgi:hypothetical protein